MDIVTALDGSLERNLTFTPGDDMTINLTVYAHDGDTTPIVTTNPQLSTGGGAYFPIGSQFTVSCVGRTPYRLAVDIAGVTTTVAYGYIESPFPYTYSLCCNCCYDGCIFPAVIPTAQAVNVLVSDEGEFGLGDDVEAALQQLGPLLPLTGALFPFANDVAAAAGGIPLYGFYRIGNAVQQRLS